MHPFERLRYVARAGPVGATLIAEEAAEALSALAYEPGALVTSARRLLGFHPTCGPLWWVCAQVLAAHDAGLAAAMAGADLAGDETPGQLGRLLRRRGAAIVAAAIEDGEQIATALAVMPTCSIRVVADGPVLGRAVSGLRYAVGEVSGWLPPELREALVGCDVALVEVLAGGTDRILTPPGGRALADCAAAAGIPVWAVGGVGRVLPDPLFEALVAHLDRVGVGVGDRDGTGAGGGAAGDLVDATALSSYVGPAGAVDPRRALTAPDCPVPAELLRPAR